MPFSISFLNEPITFPYEDATTPAATGLLILGGDSERFVSSLNEWSKRDYEMQWKNAILTLLSEKGKAALITTYGNPQVASHLEWWPMFREGDCVFFQDQLLFYDQLTRPFSMENALLFLGDRKRKSAEGKVISEWCVSLPEVETFVRNL